MTQPSLVSAPATAVTVLDRLIESLRAKNRPFDGQERPGAILWTDPSGEWRPLVELMVARGDELLMLDDYRPESRSGPAVWIRCVVDGTLEVCGRKARTGELQGFLAPGAPTTPALATKDLLLCGLHFLGEYGGYRQELAEASGLSLPVLDGALKRNTKGRWPHVKRSPHREPLPVQGSAYRYWLSIRGLEYIRERFPELRNQSSNGVYDGEEMLAEEYEPTA